jgi:hypothetical protein
VLFTDAEFGGEFSRFLYIGAVSNLDSGVAFSESTHYGFKELNDDSFNLDIITCAPRKLLLAAASRNHVGDR